MQLPLAPHIPQIRARLPGLPGNLPAQQIPGLYVHIPFCFHKCHYCDFYSITRQTPQRMERFVDLILREADLWAEGSPGCASGATVRPRTIFFGGGTPSLLPIDAMRRLLDGLRQRFLPAQHSSQGSGFSVQGSARTQHSGLSTQDFEWTVECNPATVSLEYCQMLREAGVNRLSFGAQSFDRHELATLERHHDPEDVPRSIEIARKAGFERLNVDLIYAIPGQDLSSWQGSLDAALALGTEHLSCYGLTYEENTPIAVKKRLGTMVPTEDSIELRMLHHTRERLAHAGLPPYEISNYARPGAECRHNLLYWSGESYIGLGPSAASHIAGVRWRNRPHLGEWEIAVEQGGIPTADVEQLTDRQRWGELAMLQLRLERGIEFDSFQERTGHRPMELFSDVIERLVRIGMVHQAGDSIRLTSAGLNVADAVAAEFL